MVDWEIIKALATPIAACIAIAGLFVKWYLDKLATEREKAEQCAEAFTRFAIDIKFRKQTVSQADDESMQAQQLLLLEEYAKEGKKFKFYGAQVSDSEAYELVRKQLHVLGQPDADLVGGHILLDQFFSAEYQKLLADDFANLSLERQKAAYTRWVKAAQTLAISATEVQKLLERHPELLLKRSSNRPKGTQGPNNRTGHDNLQ